MKVSDLINILSEQDPDAEVVLSSDGEGNSYSPLADYSIGAYDADTTWGGQFGASELTEEMEREGYTKEDLIEGVKAVCLWPTN